MPGDHNDTNVMMTMIVMMMTTESMPGHMRHCMFAHTHTHVAHICMHMDVCLSTCTCIYGWFAASVSRMRCKQLRNYQIWQMAITIWTFSNQMRAHGQRYATGTLNEECTRDCGQ